MFFKEKIESEQEFVFTFHLFRLTNHFFTYLFIYKCVPLDLCARVYNVFASPRPTTVMLPDGGLGRNKVLS